MKKKLGYILIFTCLTMFIFRILYYLFSLKYNNKMPVLLSISNYSIFIIIVLVIYILNFKKK